MNNIKTKQPLPTPKIYSEDLREIIEKMLNKDPDLRPDVEAILELESVQSRINKYQIKDRENEISEKSEFEVQKSIDSLEQDILKKKLLSEEMDLEIMKGITSQSTKCGQKVKF